MTKIRVLIADDSPAVRHSLQSILQRHADIEVVGLAADGVEAVTEADTLRPHVILMDAQMPGMDGVEATRRIKERLPGTRVLFMAVHARHVEAALEAGADGILMKDSSRHELVEAVRKLGSRTAESER